MSETSPAAQTQQIAAVLDARRARRKLTFWRSIAFVSFVAVCLTLAWGMGAFSNLGSKNADHIARIAISGTITNDKRVLDLIEKAKDAESVKAVIIAMNSPGGTTVGGEAIYEAILELKKEKPVVTAVGTLAASAGYMISAATDHIVVRRSSIIGSIGVIFTYADATQLLNKIGLQIKDVKTGLLKAEPAPYSTAPAEVEPALRELIGDTYDWFVDVVAENRKLDRAEVLNLADGKVFSGARGVDLKLADAIGGEDTAIAYLEKERGIKEELPVLNWKIAQTRSGFPFASLLSRFTSSNSNDTLDVLIDLAINSTENIRGSVVSVDGLSSIWQPARGELLREE